MTSLLSWGKSNFVGFVDVVESKESLTFLVDVPGLSKDDIKVAIANGVLTISGERKAEKKEDDGVYHRIERGYGKFTRAFHLPHDVDCSKVSANCDHGVLTVVLRKWGPATIQVFSAEEQGDGSLNKEFQDVPVSVFPTPAIGTIIILPSDMPLLEGVKTLSKNRILAAPVRDVTKPDDASWSEKYLGFLDFVGVVLHMMELLAPAGSTPESFEDELSKLEQFKKTTVGEASNWARFGPFVPVEANGNLLDVMLLCGEHAIRRVPIVNSPGDIVNIITQSALVQTLSVNLERFGSVANKTLIELGFAHPMPVFKVTTEQPLRAAFQLIKDMDISGVPVVDARTGKIKGNISARDVRLIVSSSKIYKLLNLPISTYLDVVTGDHHENAAITCSPKETLGEVIKRMVSSRIHRIFVVDNDEYIIRVVSLRNILRKFVREPEGYFGHYFLY